MTSREISDARIPGVACDWLSETAIVLKASGTPPARPTASATRSDSSRWLMLHGIVPVHVEAMPTIGPASRAGSMPIARKWARAGARSGAEGSCARARRRSSAGSGAIQRHRTAAVPDRCACNPARMRTRLVLLTALLVLAAAPASAHAAQSVTCSQSASTVLFWPHGHPAVKRVDFPKITTPHLEVYSPGAGYPSANFLLYADAKRFVDPSRTCGSGAVTKTGAIAHAKTIKTTKAVTCTAPAAIAYDVKRSKKGLTVIGHAGANAYFRAELRTKGSTLTYDRSLCRAGAAPH